MFIAIPLFLIAGSLVGISAIVFRKTAFLRKLTPESHEFGETVLHDYFPELTEGFKNIRFKEYRQVALVELEKFLRRLRVISLKLDHFSESLIKRIRKVHRTTSLTESPSQEAPKVIEKWDPKPKMQVDLKKEGEVLRKEEQAIIIQIAKDPKNVGLYERLGDLYMKMGDYADAVESYKTAQSLDPTNTLLLKKYSQAADKKAA
ncbi:MAG TPA: tetratricopeptide repeat protein [Candidatus Paceibacterota bacterium]